MYIKEKNGYKMGVTQGNKIEESPCFVTPGHGQRDMPVALEDHERTPCEVYSRVMGYHRPVAAFNTGKQQEHRDRVYFANAKAEGD